MSLMRKSSFILFFKRKTCWKLQFFSSTYLQILKSEFLRIASSNKFISIMICTIRLVSIHQLVIPNSIGNPDRMTKKIRTIPLCKGELKGVANTSEKN